jgi:hypothetical protein
MGLYPEFQGITLGSTHIYPQGHTSLLVLALVKGLPDNKAKIVWYTYSMSFNNPNVNGMYFAVNSETFFNIAFGTNCAIDLACGPEQIDPDLKIQNGEYKIILKASVISETRFRNKKNNNILMSNDNARGLFGFYLLPFRPFVYPYGSTICAIMFPRTIIFTPKPDLFNETPPA